MSVYFYYGDEDYSIEQAINEKKKLLDKNFSAMNFKTYDNPSFTDLISILRTTPMMFGKMLIIINCLDYFSKSFEDSQNKQIEEALSLVSEDVDIIFTAIIPRDEGKKLDTRRKLFKLLSKQNAQEFKTIPTYKTDEITLWINKYARKIGIKVEQDASLTLIEQIGNNLREFVNELDKLKLAVYPEKTVTKANVKNNCITNEDLFNFTDYIMTNKTDLALLEFRKLLFKKHELEIMSALQTMLRKWILIKLNEKKMSTFEISKITGMHEFVVKKNMEKLRKHSLKALVDLKQNLINAEYKIKSGQALDTKEVIEYAIIG